MSSSLTADPLDVLAPAPLAPHLARALDEQGYCVLPDHFDRAWCAAVGRRLDEILTEEGERAASEHHQEEGADRLANLINKGAIFDRAWLDPVLLACHRHLYQRPFKVSSLNGREAKLGGGHQPLHGDWKLPRGTPDTHHVTNALIAIDDVDPGNGGPRLVPGTHRAPRPEEVLADVIGPHPDQIIATLSAGSVLVINAHLWHGGTNNTNGKRRRVLHSYFTAREHRQQQDQMKLLRPETRARLTPEQVWLLGIDP
jgi:ectoine hydroxylase-related dioxygenase (phytanoyl-CoA dioxygenase family)